MASRVKADVNGTIAKTTGDHALTSDGYEIHAATRLERSLQALQANTSEIDSRRILKELQIFLSSLPSREAADVIVAFLDRSDDAQTKLEFTVADGGKLQSWPTLRVALLDWLAQIDVETGGHYAEKVLATPTHPDEWAVSLRNYGWAYPTPESHDFMRSKVEEMIDISAWRESPSGGFLEAFDVFVHTRSTQSIPELAELAANTDDQGRALAHAAFLTLDRLTLREPEALFREIAKQPKLMEARGEMVANFYARADLRDEGQRKAVKAYLLDPKRTQQELRAFTGVYPNNNRLVSKNLLTELETPLGSELIQHDRDVIEIVHSWLADPDLEDVLTEIEMMHYRLAKFVRQANQPNR